MMNPESEHDTRCGHGGKYMKVITGSEYTSIAEGSSPILFPEYGKDRTGIMEFVKSLRGDETIVTSSLELIDLVSWKFRKGDHELVYSGTGKSMSLREVHDLRRRLDFDVRGGFKGEASPTSILFVEGKTDAKFFKAIYKKLFGFKECREAPKGLKHVESVFLRDNFELLRREDGYHLAVIPSEGNLGVVKNMRNFLKAMNVFDFHVDRIGVAMDVDEGREKVMESIEGGLGEFRGLKVGNGYRVNGTEVIPLTIGLPFIHRLVDWEKPTVDDLMLHLITLEGLFDRLVPAMQAMGKKLKPKEVMYLALATYGYWGNLEGFYELFVMRSRFRNIKEVLRRSGIMEKLKSLVPAFC